jgi:hypothetical protein
LDWLLFDDEIEGLDSVAESPERDHRVGKPWNAPELLIFDCLRESERCFDQAAHEPNDFPIERLRLKHQAHEAEYQA